MNNPDTASSLPQQEALQELERRKKLAAQPIENMRPGDRIHLSLTAYEEALLEQLNMNYSMYIVRANHEGFLVAHILHPNSHEVERLPQHPSLEGECYGTSSELEEVINEQWAGARRVDFREFQKELASRGGESAYTEHL